MTVGKMYKKSVSGNNIDIGVTEVSDKAGKFIPNDAYRNTKEMIIAADNYINHLDAFLSTIHCSFQPNEIYNMGVYRIASV